MERYCEKCGEKLEENASFCSQCGAKIKTKKKLSLASNIHFSDIKKNMPNKTSIIKTTAIVVAALILILIIMAVRGVFTSTNDKILYAFMNTIEGSHLAKDLSKLDILSDKNFSIEANIKTEDTNAINDYDAQCTVNGKDISLSAYGYIDSTKYEFEGRFIDSIFEFFEPLNTSENILTYDYRKNNNGDAFDKDEMHAFDSFLENMDEAEENIIKSKSNEIIQAFLETFHNAEVEKKEKKECKVGKKKRSCKGYQIEFTDNEIKDLMKEVKAIHKDFMNPFFKSDSDLREEFEDDWSEFYDELEEKDLEITCYIYKKRIAYINITYGNTDLEITLSGEHYPLENAVLEASYNNEYDEEITLTGKTDNKKEYLVLSIDGEDVAEYTYQYKDGYLKLDIIEDSETTSQDISIKTGHNNIEITSTGDIIEEFVFKVKKGGKIKELKGDKVDLGDLDEDDLEKVFINE